MRFLYLTLLKQKDHILFILAVFLSYYILMNNDSPDVTILRGKANTLFARISAPITYVKSLWVLEEETQLLREKNIQLSLEIESLIHAAEENNSLRNLLGFKRDSRLTLVPARVMNFGVSANMTSMAIDVGTINGVQPDQPVIVPGGIVGKTIITDQNLSLVQMLNDVNYRLSVRMLPSGAVGILRWKKDDICEVWEIQKNAKIQIGNRIVTSGFSGIYPGNLYVGEVIGIVNERGSFQKVAIARIKPNLGALRNVFVITEKIDEVD